MLYLKSAFARSVNYLTLISRDNWKLVLIYTKKTGMVEMH